ncbi:MAG: class I SAM-dependent RNA methyltransferase, partial [Syntrophomonadaceae bacterium]|nr:class I SAM-dependent RNA methyltransferase [Syntrophomonadaceae bacterium]
MINYDIIVTCAFGLEAIVAYELKQLGYKELITENGQITFTADELAIARCNLWLRSAERVLIKVGQFKATSFEELFENTKSLAWADFLPKDANFPVAGKSIKSKLFSVSDCQAITKKAIVEKMKERYKIAWFEETGDKYQLEVALLNDIATLTIDTSGIGLHKRGYRTLSSPAPLKETLAAALINISRWKPDRAFIDPLCGSGTIPIEAALIGHNIAPGLGRDFAGEKWDNFNKKLWQSARDEAYSVIEHTQPLGIWAYDIDKEAISLARYHAKQAGVNKLI